MTKRLKRLLIKNILNAVRMQIGPEIIKRIMEKFNVGLIGKVDTKDPSAPEHFEGEFFSALNEDLNGSLIVTPEGITFSLGDTKKLGYEGNIETPLQTMVFIIEGIVGQYAFISPDIYSSFKSSSNVKFGRWGGGFLITKEAFFKEHWDKRVSWSKAKWGFSNTGPINIFEMDQTFISEMIDSTIKSTIEEFAASLRAEHGKK
ncbi:MAG: hypothetical protein JRJ85_00685 [Deltaproteobacteria bacterium]|nr:hypothetical protein [Deltaproteobacteria bacterium]